MPDLNVTARRLASLIEPIVGQVYFSPECHAEYEALGFDPSPGKAGDVALPDGPAYFTSRGSLMGQVPGEVVAAEGVDGRGHLRVGDLLDRLASGSTLRRHFRGGDVDVALRDE